MLTKKRIKDLEKQGYRIVGNHSAIKVCLWTKKALRNEDTCYKNQFYGIKSWRCIQMTPSFCCDQRCIYCWRDIDFTPTKWNFPIDKPKDIIDGCIKEQIGYLQGFRGNPKTDRKRFIEAQLPLHVAISLTAEPTFYSKLPELIKEIHARGMTTFLVSNGTNPDMLKKLIKNQPTQLYVTLPAPDEETYVKCCKPLIKDSWKKINESLSLLKKFKRSTIRLTLVKGVDMIKPELYALLIKKSKPKFVEAKAYMWVGYSRQRLTIDNMPSHKEIKEFAKEIAKHSGYKIIDEKENSRVVLLMKEDSKDRVY